MEVRVQMMMVSHKDLEDAPQALLHRLLVLEAAWAMGGRAQARLVGEHAPGEALAHSHQNGVSRTRRRPPPGS